MKIPKAEKLPSGTWRIRMRLNGESVSITANSKRECISKATLIKAEYKSGKRQSRSSGDMTISQAIDKYIKDKYNELSPSTIRGYRQIQKHRFAKHINKPLNKITDWQAVYDSDIGIASPKTLKNAFAFIRTVYRYICGVEMPKVATLPAPIKSRPYLDYDQIKLFLAAIKGHRCETAALLALHSLRRSEILSLEWRNINLKKELITVSGASVVGEDGKLIAKDTNKTVSSARTVPIFISRLTELLKKANKSASVVTLSKSQIYDDINKICKANNLPKVGIHGLRHSFASLAFHLGIPEQTAMLIGGWSDYQTMRKIYTHLAQKDYNAHIDDLKTFFAHENAHDG